MKLPKVSIIIVNYNGKQLLQKCLESLFKIDYDNFEVILVDNNSSDDTIEFVTKTFPSVIIIKLDSNKGFAEPNNIAAKISKGEYLLFLNNDTIVTKNFVIEMIKEIESDEKIAICQSLLLKPNGNIDSSGDFIDELGVVYNSKSKINNTRYISSARGASMLIRKDVFEKLGGFDSKFFATFEDVDLCWRSWIAGFKSIIASESIVYHVGGQTTKKINDEIAFHGFKNQIVMKITNFELELAIKNLILFFILYGSRELKIWFDYSLKGTTKITPTIYDESIAQKPNFRIILKSLIWTLIHPKYVWSKHRRVNTSRKFSTKVLKQKNILSNSLK